MCGAEHLWLLLREPRQLRGPVARVDLAARTGMDGVVVEAAGEPVGRVGGTRVPPGEDRRQRPAVPVEREQAVAEAGCADRVDLRCAARLLDRLARAREDPVRVVLPGVVPARRLVPHVARLVEHDRPHRRGADVEGEDARRGHRPDDNAGRARIAWRWLCPPFGGRGLPRRVSKLRWDADKWSAEQLDLTREDELWQTTWRPRRR